MANYKKKILITIQEDTRLYKDIFFYWKNMLPDPESMNLQDVAITLLEDIIKIRQDEYKKKNIIDSERKSIQ